MSSDTTETTEAVGLAERGRTFSVPRTLRLALRDLRGGLRGFYVFLACVALGVAVIAGVGALTDALKSSFDKQGQALLGGDVALSRIHVRAIDGERAWLNGQGQVSEIATLRSMARRLDASSQALVELKGVDRAYPLFDRLELKDGAGLEAAIHSGRGAAVDAMLLERLGLKLGDSFRIGAADITVRALIQREPDQIAERLPFGPRVLVSTETLMATGLVQPGSLIRWFYRVRLPGSPGEADLKAFRREVTSALPEAGFTIADRRDPSPSVTRSIERLRQFLTLIGLTSLIVGGVGVANAVATFVDRKRKVIATFKSLGASNRTVFAVFLTEVLLLAGLGVLLGLGLGILFPKLAGAIWGSALPIRLEVAVRPMTLAIAVLYGMLVALAFMLWPLGRAERVRASVLFRDEVADERSRPSRRIVIATAALGLLLAGFAILSSDDRQTAAWFCLAAGIVFAAFLGLGHLIASIVGRIPRPKVPELALALGNIAGPGSLTRSVVLSLGAGLSLLVAIALANTSIVNEFTQRLPANAPTYYVLDITKADWPGFAELVRKEAPGAEIEEAPMLRGRLVALGGRSVEQLKAHPRAQWVLNGDRGLTFAEDIPPGNRVVEGGWWPKGYMGEPLVSFEVELARRLDLKLGDMVTVNVLGRNVTARIASLRELKWENLSINFVMVFSPNTLRSAPYNLLATIRLPNGHAPEEEGRLVQRLAQAYPTITTVRIKDAVDTFAQVFGKVMTAVQVASGVTLLSGAIVLAGALATAQRRRIYQSVLLKTLGATRRRILLAHLAEYLILATVTALIAGLLGTLAAWIVVTKVMDLDFSFSLWAVVQSVLVATGLVLTFGLAGTWRVLQAPAATYLRSE
jgi:putative ABC transport system permease protein